MPLMEFITYATNLVKDYYDIPIKYVISVTKSNVNIKSTKVKSSSSHSNTHMNLVIYIKDIESLEDTYLNHYNSFKEPTQLA